MSSAASEEVPAAEQKLLQRVAELEAELTSTKTLLAAKKNEITETLKVHEHKVKEHRLSVNQIKQVHSTNLEAELAKAANTEKLQQAMITELQSSLEQAEKDRSSLQAERDKAVRSVAEGIKNGLEKNKQEMIDLKSQLDAAVRGRNEVQERLVAQEKDYKVLQGMLEELEEQTAQLTTENKKLRKGVEPMLAEKEQLLEAQASQEDVLKAVESERDEVMQQHDEALSELAQARNQHAEMEKRVQDLELQRTDLQNKQEEITKQHKELRQQHEQVSSAHSKLKSEFDDVQNLLEAERIKHTDTQKHKDMLESQCKTAALQLASVQKELADTTSSLNAVEQQKQELCAELKEARETIEKLSVKNALAQKAEKETEIVRRSLGAAQLELEAAHRQTKVAEQERDALRIRLDKAKLSTANTKTGVATKSGSSHVKKKRESIVKSKSSLIHSTGTSSTNTGSKGTSSAATGAVKQKRKSLLTSTSATSITRPRSTSGTSGVNKSVRRASTAKTPSTSTDTPPTSAKGRRSSKLKHSKPASSLAKPSSVVRPRARAGSGTAKSKLRKRAGSSIDSRGSSKEDLPGDAAADPPAVAKKAASRDEANVSAPTKAMPAATGVTEAAPTTADASLDTRSAEPLSTGKEAAHPEDEKSDRSSDELQVEQKDATADDELVVEASRERQETHAWPDAKAETEKPATENISMTPLFGSPRSSPRDTDGARRGSMDDLTRLAESLDSTSPRPRTKSVLSPRSSAKASVSAKGRLRGGLVRKEAQDTSADSVATDVPDTSAENTTGAAPETHASSATNGASAHSRTRSATGLKPEQFGVSANLELDDVSPPRSPTNKTPAAETKILGGFGFKVAGKEVSVPAKGTTPMDTKVKKPKAKPKSKLPMSSSRSKFGFKG